MEDKENLVNLDSGLFSDMIKQMLPVLMTGHRKHFSRFYLGNAHKQLSK